MKLLKVFLVILGIFVLHGECTERHKVIIIGAGAAGVSAATRLLENDIDDILVLEAEGRIGGRIHTVNFEGRNVDLGAQWVVGEKDNVVYETLERRHLLHLLARDVIPEIFYLSSRQNISDAFSEEIFNVIFDTLKTTKGIYPYETSKSILQRKYRQLIFEKKRTPENIDIFDWAEDFLSHLFMFAKGSFTWTDNAFSSDHQVCKGYQNYGWKDYGYGKFLDILINKYPDPNQQLPLNARLLFNKEVTKITTRDDSVEINCSDNSSYRAQHVVFTPSLGVLKEDHVKLFTPPLNDDKRMAIEKIGIGAVIKLFLKYDKNWWGNSSGFNFIWRTEDRELSKYEFAEGPLNQYGHSWIAEIYNVIVLPNSNILLVVFTGEMVPLIEKMEDLVLVNGITFALKKFLGHVYTVLEPMNMIRSNWYKNPHFRGTYSFSSTLSSADDVRHLMAPITDAKGHPIILFAGEATSPLHHSSAHGAVESGFREADRIINLYKK